jgi:disulfide bond formation protein DsbB
MTLLDFVNMFLAVGVIALQIFVVVATIYMLSSRFYRGSSAPNGLSGTYRKEQVDKFFGENGLRLAFILAALATAGSLFYSNYAGFAPCPLCWFQRIFMYPQVLILGLALLKKDNHIIDYSLMLSITGGLISVYHNYIYFLGLHSTICTSAESCTTPYLTVFGYITIPIMALTVFAAISLILINTRQNFKSKI